MINRAQLKQEAKDVMRGAKVSPYGFTLVYLLIGLVLSSLSLYASVPSLMNSIQQMQEIDPSIKMPFYLTYLNALPALPVGMTGFVSILVGLVAAVLEAGVVLYHLGVRQGKEMPFSTLFEGFGMAGRVILLTILESLFVALWSMLFVIPGIVAAYRYRFALYNLCENPDLSPMDAIRMSKAQTKGFKGKLFVLDLSFIGWEILSGFTSGILNIWLYPYIAQTDIGYFQTIKRIKGIGLLPENAPGESGNSAGL